MKTQKIKCPKCSEKTAWIYFDYEDKQYHWRCATCLSEGYLRLIKK